MRLVSVCISDYSPILSLPVRLNQHQHMTCDALAPVRVNPEPEEQSEEVQDTELIQRGCGELRSIGVYVRAEETEVVRALSKLSQAVKDVSAIATLLDAVGAPEPDQERAAESEEED
jgi:hypothetical protein